MWQTKYAAAISKNLGLGLNFWPCSEDFFPLWASVVRELERQRNSLILLTPWLTGSSQKYNEFKRNFKSYAGKLYFFGFWIWSFSKTKTKNLFFPNENHSGFCMSYHLFLHYGWFLQNFGKDFIWSFTQSVFYSIVF